jgi:hypothetical protein
LIVARHGAAAIYALIEMRAPSEVGRQALVRFTWIPLKKVDRSPAEVEVGHTRLSAPWRQVDMCYNSRAPTIIAEISPAALVHSFNSGGGRLQ